IARRGAAESFERVLYVIRNRCTRIDSSDDSYIASCSSKTIVYKGLMLAEQLAPFYRDLNDPRVVSRLAMVHSRFSTNTFPSWDRAHPFRLIAHNGEINTLNGNRSWMRAREALLSSEVFSDIEDLKPIIRPGGSDSAALDNVVEFLLASGRSLPHVMMMLIPEAFAENPHMPPEVRAFYEYHACLVEPWDGPAVVCFTDGERIGATLDRNGLRPGKFVVTHDGLVVLASEFGVLDIDPGRITEKGRLQPGKMFLVDTTEGRLIADSEVKHQAATLRPYRAWLDENRIDLAQLPRVENVSPIVGDELVRMQRAFGYTTEDINRILAPMALAGEEPVGSMGVDIPLAVLSERPQVLFRYFKQLFAQVTNPPVDPIREQIVMSLFSSVGGEGNLLEETPQQCRMMQLPHPILTSADLATLRQNAPADFKVRTLSTHFTLPNSDEGAGEVLRKALERLCREAREAVEDGTAILILSDRNVGPEQVAIPSLLAVSAVHHDLIRSGQRMRAGLIVESGEPREVHHLALLIGYGAGAVNPYLALDSVAEIASSSTRPLPLAEATAHYVKALKKGLLKTMSKMGISAVASYQGAQIFEAVGIDQVVIDQFFTGTASRIRGIGLEEIARETLIRHRAAYAPDAEPLLESGGHIHYRLDGEQHLWTPEAVANLQKAVRLDDRESYRAYARMINDQLEQAMTLRGLWDLLPAGPAVPLEEVEPADQIVRRFATGAMSFGSISKEAHENLAIAMNRIRGRSNTGEGGEDPARYIPDENGDSRRSAIKQVASARFGVTTQ
ncbi:MAG TPA: glutamate synthase central domain-containing protein, partial [Myxococcaceae bacterium]|nr:glutamate synthase central domain-containing protein [Myxococcaceae bacterium]